MVMQGIGLTYAQGCKKRVSRQTRLGSLFGSCPHYWRDIPAGELFERGKKNNAIYAVVLGAPASEQIMFLTAIYDEFYPDNEALLAYTALVQRQRLMDVIDWRDPLHRERVVLVYLGVKEALRK